MFCSFFLYYHRGKNLFWSSSSYNNNMMWFHSRYIKLCFWKLSKNIVFVTIGHSLCYCDPYTQNPLIIFKCKRKITFRVTNLFILCTVLKWRLFKKNKNILRDFSENKMLIIKMFQFLGHRNIISAVNLQCILKC